MTRRLYWENPYDTEFTARLKRAEFEDREVHVYLTETLFHPEGGGQPSDRGFLTFFDPTTQEKRTFRVLRVDDRGHEIAHVLPAIPEDDEGSARFLLGRVGADGVEVYGVIDWDYRFDLMQQHTGQHILSRAFEEVLDANTVGFHLGDEYVSIDLDLRDLSQRDIARVEMLANQVVFQDCPVTVIEYSPEDLPKEIRRRIQVDTDRVRVVYVGDFDACACGGTHLSSSGSVGLIKINQIDKAHGGARVFFRCGCRALLDYREKEDALMEAARTLSQSPKAVPEAVAALIEKAKLADKERESLTREIVALTEDKLAAMALQDEAHAFVAQTPGRNVGEIRLIAKNVSEKSGKPAVLFSVEPQFGLVVASPGKGDKAVDAREILSKISQIYGLRGGGSPSLAQAGSKEPAPAGGEEVLHTIRGLLGLV